MPWKDTQIARLRNVFDSFTAIDVAESLVSFDADSDALKVQRFMQEKGFDLVGVLIDGLVSGYVRREDLSHGVCADHLELFTPAEDMVADTASLAEVVNTLALNKCCFVTILDRVGAIITLRDLEKPPMRMFLFGLITITEMLLTEIIRRRYSDNSWQQALSEGRLAQAKKLQQERERRDQQVELLECLQFGDKGWILTYDDELRKAFGDISRREVRKTFKELESLRNNLAHTQEIIPSGWQRIVLLCNRWEGNMEKIIEHLPSLSEESR